MLLFVICLFFSFLGMVGFAYWTILAAAFLPPSDLDRCAAKDCGALPLQQLGDAAQDEGVVRCRGTVVALDPLTVADATGSATIMAPFRLIQIAGWLPRRSLRLQQPVEVVGRLREAALAVGYRQDAKPPKVIAGSVCVIKDDCAQYDAAWVGLELRQRMLRYFLFAPFVLAAFALTCLAAFTGGCCRC